MSTYGTISDDGPSNNNVQFLSRVKQRIQLIHLTSPRPWKQMLHLQSFDLPRGSATAIQRIKTNLQYFLTNYAIIMLLILFLISFLWHPISLIVFVLVMAAWLFLYFLRDEPLLLFHHTLDDRLLMAVLSVVTVVLLLLTGATVNIFLSVSIGVVLVVVHAAVRKTEDLCLDEDGGEAAGLLAVASPETAV